MGVRITDVVDTERAAGAERVWGWSYDTLQGHLERGRMTYEVVKHRNTGRVEFVLYGRSQPAELGRVLRLGWTAFGRRTQLRFYRRWPSSRSAPVGSCSVASAWSPSPTSRAGRGAWSGPARSVRRRRRWPHRPPDVSADAGAGRSVGAVSGAALMLSSAATRFGVFLAGTASAADPRYTVGPQRARLAARA